MDYRNAKPEEYATCLRIWERSVNASHAFLNEKDLDAIKNTLPAYFSALNVQIWSFKGKDIGFSATNDHHLEMLFIDPDYFHKGYGSKIIEKLIKSYSIISVDVNEENHEAFRFYSKHGFVLISRSEHDGMGKPYPLLHLKL